MSPRQSSLDDLIRAQRESGGMTAAQRADNRARLLSRALAGTAASVASISGASIAASARAGTGSWLSKVVLCVVLAGAGGTVYLATRPAAVSSAPAGAEPAAKLAQASLPTASLQLPPPTPTTTTAESASAEPVRLAAPSVSVKPRAVRPAPESPSLAVEVQLMHDVDSALRAGRPGLALALLDEHRGGDGGFMGEERSAARIVTLCQLGRVDAARSEAARFLRDRPRSPLAARVRATCAQPIASSAERKSQ